MQTSLEEVNSVQRRIKVDLTPEIVNEFFLKTTQDIQKKADLRGFRRGKAPLSLIKKMYGDSIAREVAQKLIETHLFEAITANQIKPISDPVIEQVDLPKEGAHYSFTALVDILPQIKLKNYQRLTVAYPRKDVSEKDVEKELQTLQKRQAKSKALEAGVKAQAGHVAKITAKATFEDGSAFAPLSFQSMSVELGQGYLPQELEDALLGMASGEEKNVSIPAPDKFATPEQAGKPLNIALSVEELSELILPALDDELAKDLSFESLAALQEEIRSSLEQNIESAKRKFLEDNLMNQIAKHNEFEVPPALTDRIITNMVNNMRWNDEKMRNHALQDEKMRESLKETAKRQAKNSLILWEIARLEDIKVEEADIDAYITKMLTDANYPADQQAKLFANVKKLEKENLRERLMFQKAMDFIINSAIIKE